MLDPVLGRECRAHPAGAGQEPHTQIGSRAAEPDRIESVCGEGRGAGLEVRIVLTPGGDRIGAVESRRGGDGIPQALEVGLTEDRARPALVRSGDDHPVDEPFGNEREVDGAKIRGLRLRDERRVEVGEKLGLGITGERDQRRTLLAPRGGSVEQKLRGASEHLLGPELDRSTADVLVAVADADALRAGPVGLPDHGARDRDVPDVAGDDDLLVGLNVRADADGELGVATEALVGAHSVDGAARHRAEPSRLRAATRRSGATPRWCRHHAVRIP